jgi:ubiquinone/menaquinone biosynthesis C-methylase UbiE
MNPEEYARLEQVESEHWFYAGKRRIVLYWLRRYGVLTPNKLLIDCGAGTGRFVAEVAQYCSAIAVDDHEESLTLARGRLGPGAVQRGSCTDLPFPDAVADGVTALDVLEHIEDDRGALAEMARVLKPEGVLVLTVPAFQALWSDWDVALHHVRRYRRSHLLERLRETGFELLHCNYVNVLACPAVYAVRKWRTLWKSGSSNGSRMEDRVPPRWLNKLLMAAFVIPASQSLLSFPFGVGILAIARRSLSSGRHDP